MWVLDGGGEWFGRPSSSVMRGPDGASVVGVDCSLGGCLDCRDEDPEGLLRRLGTNLEVGGREACLD